MNRKFSHVIILILLISLISCGDKDKKGTPEPTTTDKILVNYPWKMTKVTNLDGQDIAKEKLDLQTRFIYEMQIQFVTGNKVYARGINDQQVINGGTWYLAEDNKAIDIDISGFEGQFGLEELINSRMKLKSTMPVSGVEQETIMVFEPVIK